MYVKPFLVDGLETAKAMRQWFPAAAATIFLDEMRWPW
jgi:hypothetical protein